MKSRRRRSYRTPSFFTPETGTQLLTKSVLSGADVLTTKFVRQLAITSPLPDAGFLAALSSKAEKQQQEFNIYAAVFAAWGILSALRRL